MRRSLTSFPIWVLLAGCLALGWCLWVPYGGAAPTGEPPAAVPAAVPEPVRLTAAPGEQKTPWSQLLANVRLGQFDQAVTDLKAQKKAHPKDVKISKALRLLEEHMVHHTRADDQRTDELRQTGRRVQRCMLAQRWLTKLSKAKLDTKLRETVQAGITVFNESPTSDALDLAADLAAAKKLQKRVMDSYTKCIAQLRKADEVLKGRDDEYAEAFGKTVEHCVALMSAQSARWKGTVLSSARTRRAAGKMLRAMEYDMIPALGDVEAMVSKKPWRIGLVHTRLAKQIAVERDRLGDQVWYRGFLSDIAKRAKKSVAEAKWYDALSAYAALDDLQPDKTEVKERLKDVRRHVRVLGIYGGPMKAEGEPATKPGAGAQREEPTWKEMVSRVDVDMVKKAIEQLNGYYVTSVDFRKLTRGGLRSLKILAETPQASHSFPALGDKDKRGEFVQAIDERLAAIEKQDRVDHMDLKLALDSMLRASERTVGIPIAVVAVEFTDGFLGKLDRFSSMIWPSDVDDFKKMTMGHFCGVGIQITKEDGEPLKVVTPLAGSPAYRAGIRTNDLIVAVDGKPTQNVSIDKLIKRITGKEHTRVVLRVKRAGVLKPLTIPIIRERIHIRTVKGWRRKASGSWDYMIDPEDGIGYIRITQFTDQTPTHTALALSELRRKGARSVIVDLRFNPGGLLRAATRVANEFLEGGRIVSTRGLQTRPAEINAQTSGQFLPGNGRVIVLINRASASASEILSGAIKDRGRGMIVGARTFGKGSVQNVIPLRGHQAYLKLTTAYYYLPKGRCLHRLDGAKRWGVDPDISVRLTPRQTRRWLEMRRKTDLIQEIDPRTLTKDLQEQFQVDVQLNTAVLLLKLMRLGMATGARVAA